MMVFRWCRSASLAQPPANVCQASGLKTADLFTELVYPQMSQMDADAGQGVV
jgi:hypothetical protein